MKPSEVDPEKFHSSLKELLVEHNIEGYEVSELRLKQTEQAGSVRDEPREECVKWGQVGPGKYGWVPC